jgi:hypothetical protein
MLRTKEMGRGRRRYERRRGNRMERGRRGGRGLSKILGSTYQILYWAVNVPVQAGMEI